MSRGAGGSPPAGVITFGSLGSIGVWDVAALEVAEDPEARETSLVDVVVGSGATTNDEV